MKKVFILSSVVLSLAITGCKRDEDVTAPVIQSISVNGQGFEEVYVQAGTTMNVTLQVSDNEALSQLKVNVHSADDGHSHEGETGEETGTNIGTWTFSETTSLAGLEEIKTYSVAIPDDVAGYWHFEVMALDESGNAAEERIVTLIVENDNLPTLSLTTTPAAGLEGVILLDVNEPFLLNGTIEDADGLLSVHVHFESEDGLTAVFDDGVDVSGTSLTLTDFSCGSATAPGAYHMHVSAIDQLGYENEIEFEITVQ